MTQSNSLFCVIYTLEGQPKVAGIFTEKQIADKVKQAELAVDATVVEVELNEIKKGYISFLKEAFNLDILKLQTDLEDAPCFNDLSDFDRKMS